MAAEFEKIVEDMKTRINKEAWDGSWYLRGYDDNSKTVGSKKNKEGKIFIETQGWGVISKVADDNKSKRLLESVKKHLATKHGIILQQPAYSNYHKELGDVSAYPPGLKENAGIFCHPNPWIVIAECMASRGNEAYDYYKAILPLSKNQTTRRVEPYVYCQMVAGPDHPDFGEGKNSWLTGTAAWNFVAVSQYILGIKPDYEGLLLDPCIPSKWKLFKVRRKFRGATYDITFKNPKGVCRGIESIEVDGKTINESTLPVFKDSKAHKVDVLMG